MKQLTTLRLGPVRTTSRGSLRIYGHSFHCTVLKTFSVSSENSREADWDATTFHYMWDLAKNVPEAGIHVQSKLAIIRCRNQGTDSWAEETVLWNRKQDQHTAITDWFKELIAKRPWFADMVPDVSRARRPSPA